MGIFGKKEKPKADFSTVQSGSSTSAPTPAAQPATPPQPATTKYTVKKGDTLSAIAKREYGDANQWRRIFEANRDQLSDPDRIQPGQELTIPSAQNRS